MAGSLDLPASPIAPRCRGRSDESCTLPGSAGVKEGVIERKMADIP
ncbi:MAG TPA: hypothetical protein VGO85_15630 [Caldimonas sp.]|nr:hypothetical protein [Caldimonas sp.]